MTRYGSDVRKSREWQTAENLFQELHTWSVFSIVGASPMAGTSPEELDHHLAEILEICPRYFPVWFHRAEAMMRFGKAAEGEGFFDKGFNSMVEVVDNEEEFEKILASRVENLEKLLRYDLAARYLEKAIRVFPDTVSYYDDLAFALLQLPVPDKTGALRMQLKTLEMDPDNDFFINNLGWVYLMMGNYKDAEEHFQKAMEFDPDNPGPFKNMDAAEYMHKHRLNYFEYLVRPADMKELRELMNERHVEDVIALCGEYNADRVEAFKIHHLRKKALPPHEILNALQLVEYFMNEVAKAAEDEVYYDENEFFLYDNIELFYKKSRKLFYWFIVSSDIVDGQFLEEVGHALKVFYDFLSGAKLVSSDRFTDHLASLTSEFAGKLEEYHRLRHDVTLEEDDRETAIDRLFRV